MQNNNWYSDKKNNLPVSPSLIVIELPNKPGALNIVKICSQVS